MGNETFDENFVWYEWSFVPPRDLPDEEPDFSRLETYEAGVQPHSRHEWDGPWNDRPR